jgi:hypothetical protein
MSVTMLLPPAAAVRMTWARTSAFSSEDARPKTAVVEIEELLKEIKDKADKENLERAYVYSALACMDASLRNLETIYKGRELRFEENEKIRSVYLESVRDNIDFGNKARDFLKSLPTMAISTGGGVTVAEALNITGVSLWALGLGLAGLGYLINLLIIRAMRSRRQMLYVEQYYARDLCYDQYIARVTETLIGLYLDLERIHKGVFKEAYSEKENAREVVAGVLAGLQSTSCKYERKHMGEKRITPALWTICHTGDTDAAKYCPQWEKS